MEGTKGKLGFGIFSGASEAVGLRGCAGRFSRMVLYSALFALIFMLNLAVAMAYSQTHSLSEILPIDTNLVMNIFQVNASDVNTSILRIDGNTLDSSGTNLLWRGNTVWRADNDGSGSTLDADTIDGNNYNSNWPTTIGNIQTATSSDFHNIGGTDATDDTVSGTELDGVFSTTGLLRRTAAGTYSTITDSSTNWNSAYSHSTATSNVHGLTFTSEGTGGGLDADTVDGQQYASSWPTTLANIQTAASSDFHNIGGTDDDNQNFGEVGAGTATSRTFTVGNGAYLVASGTGVINATTTVCAAESVLMGDGACDTKASFGDGTGTDDQTFAEIGSGTATSKSFVVGNAATLGTTGTGTITANDVSCSNCVTLGTETSGSYDADASNDLTTSTSWGGDLSGTGSSPAVIDSSHLHHWDNISNKPANLDTDSTNDLITSTSFSGDVSSVYDAMVVADSSHNHDAANITSGTLGYARGGTGLGTAADDNVMVGSGSAWQSKAVPDCTAGKLLYTAATNTISCGSDAVDDSVSGTELDGVFSTIGLLRRTAAGAYSTITDSSTNWNSAYTHSTATSNVHGLTYTAEGHGGGLDADMIDGYHFGSDWPTTLVNIQAATSNNFHNIGGVDATATECSSSSCSLNTATTHNGNTIITSANIGSQSVNYASYASVAYTGDSATAFFSSGKIEDDLLSFTLQDAVTDGGCTNCITDSMVSDALTASYATSAGNAETVDSLSLGSATSNYMCYGATSSITCADSNLARDTNSAKLYASGDTYGLYGVATTIGVYGSGGAGVEGHGDSYGVRGYATSGFAGLYGEGGTYGVYGTGGSNAGVYGNAYYAVRGDGGSGFGGYFTASSGAGDGISSSGARYGVMGSGGASYYDFYANGAGTNYGPFTGAHDVILSEDFPENPLRGMIVSVTGETKIRLDEDNMTSVSSTLPTVRLASTPNDKSVLGAFVSETKLTEKDQTHWYKPKEGERLGIVNALGEGRLLVTNITGLFEAGDYLTTSQVPGYGQKQDDDLLHSYTLAKVTEDVDWSGSFDTVEYAGKTYKMYLIGVVYVSG